jgi:hypothetical protein
MSAFLDWNFADTTRGDSRGDLIGDLTKKKSYPEEILFYFCSCLIAGLMTSPSILPP